MCESESVCMSERDRVCVCATGLILSPSPVI